MLLNSSLLQFKFFSCIFCPHNLISFHSPLPPWDSHCTPFFPPRLLSPSSLLPSPALVPLHPSSLPGPGPPPPFSPPGPSQLPSPGPPSSLLPFFTFSLFSSFIPSSSKLSTRVCSERNVLRKMRKFSFVFRKLFRKTHRCWSCILSFLMNFRNNLAFFLIPNYSHFSWNFEISYFSKILHFFAKQIEAKRRKFSYFSRGNEMRKKGKIFTFIGFNPYENPIVNIRFF